MIAKRLQGRAARWLIVMLLFAQAAVAANACLAAASARVAAVAAASHEGCDTQQENLSLCLYHCADQYRNQSAPEFVVIAPMPVALHAPAPVVSGALPVGAWSVVHRSTGPPIPIRHCSLRI
jgi:hypothetical protein